MPTVPHISQTDKHPFALVRKKQHIDPHTLVQPTNPQSISGWIHLYYLLIVKTQARKTKIAKLRDLRRFLSFYRTHTKSDNVSRWLSSVTKAFQESMQNTPSPVSQKPYETTTINRTLATIKHFAGWLMARHVLPDGHPTLSIKDIPTDEPDWQGLTQEHISALKKSCEDRLKQCSSKRENPTLEAAVFYTLLYTGLRESELLHLNRSQYHDGALHQVKRKNNRITPKIPLPSDTVHYLDHYLAQINSLPEGPLFVSCRKTRLTPRSVGYICERLAHQAQKYLEPEKKFHITPHQLRHTFLKNVTEQYGMLYAREMSGSVSMKELFRYTKQNQSNIDQSED